MRKLMTSLGALAVTGATATVVRAADQAPNIDNPLKGQASFGSVLNTIINGLLIFAGAVAVLFLIIGGFRYVVSAGNPDQVEGAKKTILYAVLGLVIIFVAFLIVNFILNDVLKVKGNYVPG